MPRPCFVPFVFACNFVLACNAPIDPDAGRVADAGGARDAADMEDAGASGWRSEPPLPLANQEIAVAAHAGRIWVAGGFELGAVVATVRVYDPSTRGWTEGPSLPAPRHHLALVSFGRDLYAIGGMEGLEFAPLDTAWVLREGASAWEDVAPLPIDRGASAAARAGDRIVVAGGNQTRGGLAVDTLLYDPSSGAWTLGAPIPTRREHLAAVAIDGELWVLGGRRNSLDTNTNAVEIYDPVADAWRDGPRMPAARGGFGAAVLDGVIYVIGGEQPDRALATADRFDSARMTWSSAPPVPTPRHGHGVVALEGRVWVVGGADEPIFAAVAAVESYAP